MNNELANNIVVGFVYACPVLIKRHQCVHVCECVTHRKAIAFKDYITSIHALCTVFAKGKVAVRS